MNQFEEQERNIFEERIAAYNAQQLPVQSTQYYNPEDNKRLEDKNDSKFQNKWEAIYRNYMVDAVTKQGRVGTCENHGRQDNIYTRTVVHTEFGPIKRIIYNSSGSCYEGIFEITKKDDASQMPYVQMQYVYMHVDYNGKPFEAVTREYDGTFTHLNLKSNQYDIIHYFSFKQSEAVEGNLFNDGM